MGMQENLSMINQVENMRKIDFESINESQSRAKVKLTEMSQQLQMAEKKVNNLDDRLGYMKYLYQSALPAEQKSLPVDPPINPVVFSNRERRKKEPEIRYNNIKNHANVENNSPATKTAENSQMMQTENSQRIKLIDYLSTTKEETLKKMIHEEERVAKICRERVSEEPLVSSPTSSEESEAAEIIETREIFIPSSPSPGKTTKKSELILKITSARAHKNKTKKCDKILTKTSRLNSAVPSRPEAIKYERLGRFTRIKRSKLRIKRISSKPVISKHNTIGVDIKPVKKMRRRVNRVKDVLQLDLNDDKMKNTVKIEEKSNEVVEIYTNDAAKNASASAVSSKQHFKLQLAENNTANNNLKHDKDVKLPRQTVNLNKKAEKTRDEKEIQVDIKPINFEAGDQTTTCRRKEAPEVPVLNHRHEDCQSAPVRSWCCESFGARSYLQPTISSTLKQANKCYFARFHLNNPRNIPFVVGTSVTPTHNLGLNIQQTLSLMKQRQPGMTSELRSVFTRKVVETLENPMLSVAEEIEQGDHVYDTQDLPQTVETGQKSANLPTDMTTATRSVVSRQRAKELEPTNNQFQRYVDTPKNSRHVQSVIISIHDQVEAMNEQLMRMQEEAEKSNDEVLKKECRELENALIVREEEIHLIGSLYMEVMALKQQLRMIYDGRSNVYQLPFDVHHRPKRPATSRALTATTRLVGLLRQIQSFQQQLTA